MNLMRRLDPAQTALLVIDWQERLFPAMPEGERDDALRRAGDLVWLAGALEMPVVVSEQYPRGLGPTLAALGPVDAVPKLTFSAFATPDFAARVQACGRPTLLVTGMETHICVAQTCRDAVAAGYDVWLVADACLSRRPLDAALGRERIRDDGARVVTTEAACFELVGAAGTPLFRALSQRVK